MFAKPQVPVGAETVGSRAHGIRHGRQLRRIALRRDFYRNAKIRRLESGRDPDYRGNYPNDPNYAGGVFEAGALTPLLLIST